MSESECVIGSGHTTDSTPSISLMEDNFLPISITSFVLGLLFRRLEYSFQSAAERTDALSRVCDSGVNINLLSSKVDIGRDLSSSQTPQDFPLVCVKGVVKAYDHDMMTRYCKLFYTALLDVFHVTPIEL